MREDSPRWEQVNPSDYGWEKDGLRELAGYLPDADPYHVWANVEFVGADGSINEIDALVLTPNGLYVLELRHWQGEIRGAGSQWTHSAPNSRLIVEDNPYVLANRKAQRLASLMKFHAEQHGREAEVPFVGAAVFLHAPDVRARLDAGSAQYVYGLDGQESGLPSLKRALLLAQPSDPEHRVDPGRARQIVELVRAAKVRPSVTDRRVGQLRLRRKPFAEGLGWQDFLGDHVLDPAVVRRVRFYLTHRAPEHEVSVIRAAAEREFRLLQGIQHPGIAQAYDLVEHPWGRAVVFAHDPEWVRLDQWLPGRGNRLSLTERLRLVQSLAETIEYAHSRRLSHRALSPRAVFVADSTSATPNLVLTNWQTGKRLTNVTRLPRLGSSTDPASLELFFDDEVRRYQAPEATGPTRAPGDRLDVFALGALAYRIFAGAAPAGTPEELASTVRDSGLRLDAVVDGMPYPLIKLIYDATRGDPAQRLGSVSAFREGLEEVWQELTTPEPEPVVDPLNAHRGDVVAGDLEVKDRLGQGATALALLVSGEVDGSKEELVLKVARDEQHSERLIAEARTLANLKHRGVAALVRGPDRVGGRTVLLLESAGRRTLAEDLRAGRLTLDLLQRYGRDLLEIVSYLDGQGVWHRDLKPANLAASARRSDKQPHLCVFDFSLSSAPPDQLLAGTVGYLDPFLGPPRRLRYDPAAERFAAAVTLYEMATGTLPRWGDNANPVAVSDEVTLDPAAFDPAVADGLVEFFRRALARDADDRFDSIEAMTDAWRAVLDPLPPSAPGLAGAMPASPGLTRESPLDAAELTARARSALERLGLHTVGELLDAEPSTLTRAKGVPDATRKEILARRRALRVLLPGEPDDESGGDERRDAQGVEAVCDTLLPAPKSRDRRAVALLLGQVPTAAQEFPHWPTQAEVIRETGRQQSQISRMLKSRIASWSANEALTAVRDEIVALLDTRGAVMSADELAQALISARGSYTSGPKRLSQAVGLVRAAAETELATGGDARVAMHRLRNSGLVLVGREPDDPTAKVTAADLLGYVVRLGRRARELAELDPLPSRQRAIDEFRRLSPPPGMPVVGDLRLSQLAALGSDGAVDVNAQGQLYPVGMPAERTLRMAAGALIGQRLDAEAIRDRVHNRFPRAEKLPGRPELTNLLNAANVPLSWHATESAYLPRGASLSAGGTRTPTTHTPWLGLNAADDVTARLRSVIERRGFLALLAPFRRLGRARRALLDRLPLTEVSVAAVMLDRLRAIGYPWEAIVAADTGSPTDSDFRTLIELVQHHVVPGVAEALAAADGPVLITEAAPLARYGQLRLLQELADPTRPRPAARLLLVPARRQEPVMLDRTPLPLTSPASQSQWLADAWIDPLTAAS